MGILLVYDVTEEDTFHNIKNWLRQIEQHAVPGVRKILVANKVDRPENERKIDSERGRQLAEEHGLLFFEASAKSGLNVTEIFAKMAEDIISDF